MAINFPGSPTLYQIFTSGENSFIWNGKQWVGYSTSLTVNYNASSVALESNNAVVGATTTFNFDSGFSISYDVGIATISGPSLVGYATEGYVDNAVSGVSTFSGDYNDLTNKPIIPSDTGDLTNNVGFITAYENYWELSNLGIHTTSNIGIGTTDPISQLDVLGTVNFDCNDGNTFTSVGIGTSIVDISTPVLNLFAPNIAINTPGGYFQTDVGTFILNSDAISLNSLFPQTFTLPTISIASSASGLPATFTLGQNIDGSGEDHLGLIYDNFGGIPGTGGVARIFTSNGDLKIVTDYNGISTGSNITIGSEDIIFTDKTETQEYVRINSSGVGIGTTNARFALEVGAVGASGTTLMVNGNARVTGILTIGQSSVIIDGNQNTVRANKVSGIHTSSLPLGDYGNLSSNYDAFGISIISVFDCLTDPAGFLPSFDFGVL